MSEQTKLEELAERIAEKDAAISAFELNDEQREALQNFAEFAARATEELGRHIREAVRTIVRDTESIVWVFQYSQLARAEDQREYAMMQAARHQWVRLE